VQRRAQRLAIGSLWLSNGVNWRQLASIGVLADVVCGADQEGLENYLGSFLQIRGVQAEIGV
jgi:hypothetical protein